MSHRSSSNRPGAKTHGAKAPKARAAASNRSHSISRSTGPASDAKRPASSLSSGRRAVSGLSDRGLLNATAKLAKTERLTTLEILVLLNEVEKRELYLTLGCGSMLDYCMTQLGYSRSAAWRRIHSSRCLGHHPELHELVEKNELSLTTLFLIAGTLTKDNKTALLGQVRGKSESDVQTILAAYRPPAACRDRVKPVRVAVPVAEPLASLTSTDSSGSGDLGLQTDRRPDIASGTPKGSAAVAGFGGGGSDGESTATAPDNGGSREGSEGESSQGASGTPGASGKAGPPRYSFETRFDIEFVASKAFMTKYQEACALLSNTLPKVCFEAVFETALDAFLDKHSPAKKQERREKRAAAATKKHEPDTKSRRAAKPEDRAAQRRSGDAHPQRPNANSSASADQLSRKKFDERFRSGTDIMLTSAEAESDSERGKGRQQPIRPPKRNPPPEKTRHISAKTRDAVFIRDKNRCTHIGSNGKRCGSTHRLQIDHIFPFARGGTNALSNLRLLCAKHNRLEAKRVYGAAKIDAHCRRE